MPRDAFLPPLRYKVLTSVPRGRIPGRPVRKSVKRSLAAQFSYPRRRQYISQYDWSKVPSFHDWKTAKRGSHWYDDQRFTKRERGNGRMIAVKDNFISNHLPTTCASLILDGFESQEPSAVCDLLTQNGYRIAAKTNMDEFGMGSHSTHSAWGYVSNGEGKESLSVGGSSGGSAFAVASGHVQAAIGSDTGGSVRLPAAYTGTVGFKPSYGRISRDGLIPYANSLDTVGIISETVYDAFLLFKLLDRPDYNDPTSLSDQTRFRIQSIRQQRPGPYPKDMPSYGDDELNLSSPAGLVDQSLRRASGSEKARIGVPDEYMIEEMHPLVRAAWRRLIALLRRYGNHIVPISLPTTKMALAAYYVIAPAEASSNLAKYDGVRYGAPRSDHPDDKDGTLYANYRGEKFGPEVQRRILLGTFSLSAGAMDNYFIQAQKVRRLVQDDFNRVFSMPHPLLDNVETDKAKNDKGVDFIIVPTAPTLPPLISDVRKQTSLDAYINDVFTVPASLAGLPAISVPVIFDDGIAPGPGKSIGMQIIGQYGDDYSVLNFARDEVEPLMLNLPASNVRLRRKKF